MLVMRIKIIVVGIPLLLFACGVVLACLIFDREIYKYPKTSVLDY